MPLPPPVDPVQEDQCSKLPKTVTVTRLPIRVLPGSIRSRMTRFFGSGRSSSRGELQFRNTPDAGDLCACQVAIQVGQMLPQILQALALSPVVRVLLEAPEPVMPLLSVDVPRTHSPYTQLVVESDWRRGRDSNPRYRFRPVRRFSKPLLSTTQPPLRRWLGYLIMLSQGLICARKSRCTGCPECGPYARSGGTRWIPPLG